MALAAVGRGLCRAETSSPNARAERPNASVSLGPYTGTVSNKLIDKALKETGGFPRMVAAGQEMHGLGKKTRPDTPVANQARQVAERIDKLPDLIRTVVDANLKPAVEKVQKALNPVPIEFECVPVCDFIEKHWTPDHAANFMARVANVSDALQSFIATITHLSAKPSEWLDRKTLAEFRAVAMLTADTIRSWADDIERRELTATAGLLADEDGAPRTPTETEIEPKEIILGYKDIFAALRIKHRDQLDYKVACRSFKRKCEADGAPVKFRNKKPPIVEKGPLLDWWNSQLLADEARDQAAIDREATLSEGYQHGRVGTEVKPNIAGYVRKRAN